ncbi:hypothetical protein V8F33_007602 [Rhypophila sp. PSN 637]
MDFYASCLPLDCPPALAIGPFTRHLESASPTHACAITSTAAVPFHASILLQGIAFSCVAQTNICFLSVTVVNILRAPCRRVVVINVWLSSVVGCLIIHGARCPGE